MLYTVGRILGLILAGLWVYARPLSFLLPILSYSANMIHYTGFPHATDYLRGMEIGPGLQNQENPVADVPTLDGSVYPKWACFSSSRA